MFANHTDQKKLIELSGWMGQATDINSDNAGFGFLYYGLTRLYQPDIVVCIGSYRGFSPVCFTLGLVDNRRGQCYFIDPGKVDQYWHHQYNIEKLTLTFGLDGRWHHFRKTSKQFIVDNHLRSPIDILHIDGDHSYDGVKYDFDHYAPLVRSGGLILLHDSIAEGVGFTKWEVKDFISAEVYGQSQFEVLTLSFDAGLTLVKKLA